MTWDTFPLADLGTWYGGATPSKTRGDFWVGGTVPWLSPKDMGYDVVQRTQNSITDLAVESSSVKLVPAGSVAVVVRSGILERTLPVGLVPFATTLNQDMKALHPREGIDPRWVAWGLRTFEHDLLRQTRKDGTTVASIEWPRFQQFELPVPPLDKQRRIIELLEDHLSRLDAARESVNTSIRRSSAMVTSSLSAIVAAESAVSPVSTVGAEAERVEYGSSARCHASPRDGDIPVLRMGNLKNGKIDPQELKFLPRDHPEFPKLLLARGDLLFNRTNSAELVGKSAVFDSATVTSFASYLIRVRFSATVDPRWANIVINSPQGRAHIASVATQQVGQANVNGTKLKAFPLPLPSLTRQRKLVAVHERIADDAGRLSTVAEGSLSRSAVLRRSLLAAAFSGHLLAETAPA